MTQQTTTARPLVTFALFAYNQEKYIREAVESAFSQTYEPLEIILSDDCSSDRTFEIMQEMAAEYKGPHEVRVRCSEVNRGVLSHVLSVAHEANGDIFVVGAGDDISFQKRVEVIVQCFAGEDIYAFSSDDIIIDEHGKETDWDTRRIDQRDAWHKNKPAWVHGATAAYRTDFLKLLPIPENPVFYEDMAFIELITVLKKNSIRYRYPLIKYRYHFENLSNRLSELKSLKELEDVAIEGWRRTSVAKDYSVNSAKLLTMRDFQIDGDAYKKLSGESRYLSLIANWKENRLAEKFSLIYFGLRYGNVKASLARVWGESIFFKLKRVRVFISTRK